MWSTTKSPARLPAPDMKVSGIVYLPFNEFLDKYPFLPEEGKTTKKPTALGEGSTGKVFPAGEKYVVKQFPINDTFRDFIEELNFYAAYRHPCILYPKNWTIKDKVGYLAMKRGEDAVVAFINKQITLQQIMIDTLSVIAFLNSHGIMHCDIKPANMVFRMKKGRPRCYIIDLGLARRGELNKENNTYYVKGIAYTIHYKDPEYVFEQYNNINCEVYSLAASYIHFLKGSAPDYGEVYIYLCRIIELQWVFDEAAKFCEVAELDKITHANGLDRPVSVRGNTSQILKVLAEQYSITPEKGVVFHENVIVTYSEELVLSSLRWLVQVAYYWDYKAETLFLALHLFHRVYTKLRDRRIVLSTEIDLKILVCVCLNIAAIVVGLENIFQPKDWNKVCSSNNLRELSKNFITNILIEEATRVGDPNLEEITIEKQALRQALPEVKIDDSSFELQFILYSTEILKTVNGIISTTTYWDHAKSDKDLFPYLMDSIGQVYNSSGIRPTLPPGGNIVSNKCIKVHDFIVESELFNFQNYDYLKRAEIPRVYENLTYPCVLNLEQNVEEIKLCYVEFKQHTNVLNRLRLIAAVIHNRDKLGDLKPEMARDILIMLINVKGSLKFLNYILDKITKFNWTDRDELRKVVNSGYNPFSVTEGDLF